jgi:hypothetical protein
VSTDAEFRRRLRETGLTQEEVDHACPTPETYGEIRRKQLIGAGATPEQAEEGAQQTRLYYATRPTAGRKDDQGKPKFTAIAHFRLALAEICAVLDHGTDKYGSHDNWRRVENCVERYEEAGLRHYLDHLDGVLVDVGTPEKPGSNRRTLANAACCILFLLQLDLEKGGA